MRGKKAKRLRREAEAMTAGQPAHVTRQLYQRLKRITRNLAHGVNAFDGLKRDRGLV